MSTSSAASAKNAGKPESASAVSAAATRSLPLVTFFENDETGKRAMLGVQRYRRVAFENLNHHAPDVERVLLTASEKLLQENYAALRAPNIRILALADARFKDPRLDGAIYAYLPTNTPTPLLERMVDNAIDHIHLLLSRKSVNERLAGATREIHELNQIGAALSAEHDTGKLLEAILTKCRDITNADAGSLYLVEPIEHEAETPEERPQQEFETGSLTLKHAEPHKRLRFKLTQNDSVEVPFREFVMEISDKSIAGYVALTGDAVNLEDAYHPPEGVPYSFNRKWDEDSGYRTKSMLAVPMRNQKDEVVGVVQLINAKREREGKLDSIQAVVDKVLPFTQRQQEIVTSLASQAAVAFENSQLYEAIQKLFEGFVRASVIAIEARDPTTSGHSFRVANLTVALAESVDRAPDGPFADVHFTRTEMKEIRYASLLHDFGKVGVREEVLVKAKKLYPAQLELIRQRFHFVKRTLEKEVLKSRLEYALAKGREEYMKQSPTFDQKLGEQLQQLDDYFQTVLTSDEPTVLPEGNFERLLDIAARSYLDFEGGEKPLLTGDEVRLLSIRKGSLDDAERVQIESHVVHSFNFLKQIPWTREIRNIPAIARGHHEKLNGRGYPYKLSAPEIPVQTRMMTISDIFDALAAADRPYKRAVTAERALEILGYAVKDGELDPNLFGIFLAAKVFERWKIEPYPY
ncbi:MAG TPA: HD domain-containing phosphohydrolase [Terriglobales bacterium]|jgi:HD-GYP domain-containing protein (c-di-GMP phosphodiesterase class II)|nr:HD domain-containing phosphohydrolase [Terriglobales bacterium]